MRKLIIVLPALNEAKVIGQVLDNLKKEVKKLRSLNTEIVVVDDGSWDKTAAVSRSKGVTVLSHPINRGLGGALGTGIEYARQNNSDFVITFDSDGQHDSKDINKVITPLLKNQADVVIGIRDKKKMPWDRRIVTVFSSFLTLVFFGDYCSDTQSGFRGFNKRALDRIKIRTQRMEVASELFGEINKHSLSFVEVPIRVIYTPYSREKGQKNVNAFKILIKLILRLFR